jgi:UTP-glucose-1-phosphate uridylyltransferase
MDIEFRTLEELYQRIKPALKTKQSEMHRMGYDYIKEEDIWNYLKEIKWKNAKGLGLYDMVSDILNSDELAIDSYLKKKLNENNRTVYFNDGE